MPDSVARCRYVNFLRINQRFQSRKISAPSFASSLRPHRPHNNNNTSCCPPAPSNNPCTPPTPSSLSCSATPIKKKKGGLSIKTGEEKYMDLEDDELESVFFYPTTSEGHQTSSSSVVNTPIVNVTSIAQAVGVIEALREKFRSQGQQVITYRRKLRQQKVELCDMRLTNRQQLEDISSQLILFESNLRGKEKQLQDTLNRKDQVILKQQRVIKRLLRKCYGADFCPPSPARSEKNLSGAAQGCQSFSGAQGCQSSEGSNVMVDYDGQNDSDSAIMLEDNMTEVSLLVPHISLSKSSNGGPVDATSEVKVIRSISDVIKARGQQEKQLQGRKTKEERRISNRQKLLTIAKRHSGFLKRPEILETVYSVEEDTTEQQQNNPVNVSMLETSLELKKLDRAILDRQVSVTDSSPSTSRRSSSCILTGFRYRLDSDDPADYSTEDDDSTRIPFYSETDNSLCGSRRSSYTGGGAGFTGGPCSLPCSRRSSYGGGGNGCGSTTGGSRRSSYGGSHANLNSNSDESSELKVQTKFNRVMSNNHRAVTKPKDVKFKRINKAKSRSLEELRGKLKWQLAPSVIDILEDEDKIVEKVSSAIPTAL